jgi:hypothetical protein
MEVSSKSILPDIGESYIQGAVMGASIRKYCDIGSKVTMARQIHIPFSWNT